MGSTFKVEPIFWIEPIYSDGVHLRGGLHLAFMKLESGKYYHLYNRTNNREKAFKSAENYAYFLSKYKKYIKPYVDTIAYCLMPTHFHFLMRVATDELDLLRDNVGILLSSYTKAVNKQSDRNGSLFQRHTKAIEVDDESYLITLCIYIHQNPIRAGLVTRQEDWEFSSYRDYIGIRTGDLLKTELIKGFYKTPEEFKKYSEEILPSVNARFWV